MRNHIGNLIHRRDLERFRLGLGGTARYFNDGGPEFLPADLRGDPALKDFKDVASLAKSFLDTKAYVGSSLRPPSADAGEKDWAEFDKKLQEKVPGAVRLPKDPAKRLEALREYGVVPKEAKDYKADGITFEPGTELSEQELEAIRASAHKQGLLPEHFRERVQEVATSRAAQLKAVKENQTALKKEWGATYDEKLALARGALEKSGAPEELRKAVEQGTATVGQMNWLLGIARSIGAEARDLSGQRGTPTVKMTPMEAMKEQRELMRNEVYLNPGKDPELHRRIVQRVADLQAYITPDEA